MPRALDGLSMDPLQFPVAAGVPDFDNGPLEVGIYAAVAVILLFLGYRLGRMIGAFASHRAITQKEQELFTAQRGFKNLYEQELSAVKGDNAKLQDQVRLLNQRVEDYRRKAAGFGGLFGGSGGKRADAMYALLMENEALEEALYAQNEKLKQERTDSLKEQLRATGYRRVLMSQLLNDQRIKEYVREIMEDEKHLPAPDARTPQAALPPAEQPAVGGG